jgi:hypothetical protein
MEERITQEIKKIIAAKKAGLSLRKIAANYKHVTFADISRILKDVYPVMQDKRDELGLPCVKLAAVCPVHGKVCVKNCKATKPRRPRWQVTPPRCGCGGKTKAISLDQEMIFCTECSRFFRPKEIRIRIQYRY